MVSISGVRGIVGESLTPEVIVRYTSAFAGYCRERSKGRPLVILGRDGRVGGKIIGNLVSSTLLAGGVDVCALGICPTPTVQLAVEKKKASGGISITASHNPIQWNGLKFLGPSGMFLDAEENAALWKLADKGDPSYAGWDSTGNHVADDTWLQRHLDAVLADPLVDPELIRPAGLKIVVDCVNGAGGVIVPNLLRALGCTVIEMNCDLSGRFAHTPEPIPENLGDLCARVLRERAHLGIAIDPDGDRLVFITEKGEPFGEEYTITAAVKYVLSKTEKRSPEKKAVVATNLSTTRAIDDVAAQFGATVIRTPVGEINVARAMQKSGALIGGEGSGGVIYPPVHLGRDAMAGIPLVLQLLIANGGTMSDLKRSLPHYVITKSKIEIGSLNPASVLAGIRSSVAKDARVNDQDGLRIDMPDSWVHLRKSNTEPIIRIIAEATTEDEAARLVDEYRRKITGSAR